MQLLWQRAKSFLTKVLLQTEPTEANSSDRCNEKAEMVMLLSDWFTKEDVKCLHWSSWYVNHASNWAGSVSEVWRGHFHPFMLCVWAARSPRENEGTTYTKLLSDARLRCCCCCVCCCCCCGCWEMDCCCCHVVGNKPPGDARACRAVMSALVSW